MDTLISKYEYITEELGMELGVSSNVYTNYGAHHEPVEWAKDNLFGYHGIVFEDDRDMTEDEIELAIKDLDEFIKEYEELT